MSANTALSRSLFLIAVAAVAFFAGRLSRSPAADASRPAMKSSTSTRSTSDEDEPLSALAKAGQKERKNVRADFSARVSRPSLSLAADDERQKFLEQWAEHDPLGAIEFARTKLKGDRQAQALSSILAIWGKNDPAAAWNWVLTTMPSATHHFDTLLEVFGKNDPATAARFVNEFVRMHPETALEVNLAALLGITYNGDFTAARAFVDGNSSVTPEVRSNLNNFIAGQWARYDPTAAAAWTMTLPAGPQRDQALVGLGESWAEVDPAGAANFATTLPPGESRSLALRQAITSWLETDADQARQWVLDTDRHEDYDQAVVAVATQNNFMFREPDHALQWTGTIFDEGLRLRTTATILAGLYSRDPGTTVAYIRGMSDVTEAQRAQLLSQFTPKE